MGILAWHFAADDNRLCYGDGRLITVGETHEVKGEPVPCVNGLHASEDILMALAYSQGPMLHRVRLSGKIAIGHGKVCAQRREYLWGIHATLVVQLFIRRHALAVARQYDMPSVVLEYLETGNQRLQVAAWRRSGGEVRAAILATARFAPWTNSWNDIERAAQNIVEVEARIASRDATRDATGDVAWGATRAARGAARDDLISLVMQAAHGEVPGVTVGAR